jgi:hypothetical protein
MSQPEIFRRCSECGASFSSADLFCPGCGVPTVKTATETEPNTEHQSLPVEAAKQTVPLKPNIAATVAPVNPGHTIGRAKPSVLVRDKRDRKLPGPVGKFRKGTTIVMDEAAYDPSLRFVLVAIILFILFLVLLLLSKWIG